MHGKLPSHQEQVAALAAEGWSPTRVIAEHESAMDHVQSGYARYEAQSEAVTEADLALRGLEKSTGIPRVDVRTPEGMKLILKKDTKEGLTPDEQAVLEATSAYNSADIVAASAKGRADSQLERSALIKDAYLDILRAQAVKEAHEAGVNIHPMVDNAVN